MLDLKTIFALAFAFNLSCGIILIFYKITKETNLSNSIKGIATGLILIGSGVLLISLRYYLTELQSIIIANMLLILGMIIYRIYLNRFLGVKDLFDWADALIVTGFFCLLIYSTFLAPDTCTRIIIITIVLSYSLVKISYTLLRKTDIEIRKESLLASSYFISFIFINLMRIIHTVLGPEITDFLESHGMQTFFAVMILIMPIVTIVAIFAMINRVNQNRLITRTMIDCVTGLYSRIAIMEFAESEISRAQRNKESMAVVLIDIDLFKSVNDTYGHLIGDKILQEIGSGIKNKIRASDKIGRFGGDEFMLIIPNIDKANLEVLLEDIRILAENAVVFAENKQVAATISMGACVLDQEPYDFEKTIIKADAALYIAKNNGRNSISIQ